MIVVRIILYLAWTSAFAALAVANLAQFPGIHSDEAWMGLRAIEMQSNGIGTVSGMTWYTGSIYPYLVSISFDVFGVNNWALRVPAVVSYVMFLFIVIASIWRYFGFFSAVVLAGLLGQSLLFIWYGRISWEITGLDWLLFAIFLSLLFEMHRRVYLDPRKGDIGIVFLLNLSGWFGSVNHIIFSVMILAIVVASLLSWVVSGTEPARRFATRIVSVCFVLPLLLIKLPILATSAPIAISYVLITPILGFCSYYLATRAGLTHQVLQALKDGALFAWRTTTFRWLVVVLLATAAGLFSTRYAWSLFQVLANTALVDRVASGGIHLSIRLIYWGVSVAIIAQYIYQVFRQWADNRAAVSQPVRDIVFLLFLATIFFLLLMPILKPAGSIRFLAMPVILIFVSIAIMVPRNLASHARLFLGMIALSVLVTLSTDILAKRSFGTRPPKEFSVGLGAVETSAHFLSLQPITNILRDQKICVADLRAPISIMRSLEFAYSTKEWACSRGDIFKLDYCKLCDDQGYFDLNPLDGE
jgi:hypothetical protein